MTRAGILIAGKRDVAGYRQRRRIDDGHDYDRAEEKGGRTMADQKALACKTKPAKVDVGAGPKAGLNGVDESPLRGERAEPWAAGFVTSEGIHIPLFVPRVPQELGESL